MNALTNFNTPFSTTLRVLNREGQPWFIAKDVCEALDLKGFASYHTRRLDRSEIFLVEKSGSLEPSLLGAFTGRTPSITLVSESGFYKLIMRSDKQEARKFQDWVTGVVLPAIRKDGGYILDSERPTHHHLVIGHTS